MTQIVAIDPGTTESAYAVMIGKQLEYFGKLHNDKVVEMIEMRVIQGDVLAIEQVASYGMPVGAEVFATVHWAGRFEQAWRHAQGDTTTVKLVTRNAVKMALCYRTQGVNDGVIRQRVIDLYGGKDIAIGKKKTPGPLYGVSGDEWAAVALGLTVQGISGDQFPDVRKKVNNETGRL